MQAKPETTVGRISFGPGGYRPAEDIAADLVARTSAPRAGPGTAEVSVRGPCDGFGDPEPRGAYVELRIETALSEQRHRISRGAAEVLLAELQGVLANAR